MNQKKVVWPIEVHTKRLVLRPYRLSDYEGWKKAFTSRKPKQHKYDRGPVKPKSASRAMFRKFYFRHGRYARKDICYVFGLFHKKTGALIGVIDISTICRDWYQWASVGYVVHNTDQGKGYGKEAVRAALKIAFQKLGYKRVEASIYADNKPSLRLAKSVGMKRAEVRKEYIFENKKWEDHVVYVALNPSKARKTYFLLKD